MLIFAFWMPVAAMFSAVIAASKPVICISSDTFSVIEPASAVRVIPVMLTVALFNPPSSKSFSAESNNPNPSSNKTAGAVQSSNKLG